MHFLKFLVCAIISLLIFPGAQGQQPEKKYDVLWKKVDELYRKQGLTRSALTEVNKIYALAKKENSRPQLIRALIYLASLEEATEDEPVPAGITRLEREIKETAGPVRSILQSILAVKTWNYFQQNRYRLYSRTQTLRFSNDDMSTWSVADFHERISGLFLASLENRKVLQQTKVDTFEPIIIKGNMRHLRPTLYDLLAHRALDYFRNDEPDINRPAYAFEIREEAYFQPAMTFSRMRISSKDSLSLHHKALLIYQDLLSFHANDASPDALIDADLGRLGFLNMYGVMENKDSLYRNALEHLAEQYKDLPAAAQAWYLLAEWHAGKAASYDPLRDSANRYEYRKALEICSRLTRQQAASEGKSNALILQRSIQQKELHLTTEKVNIPGQPFRTLVSYRNFDQAFFRIIPLSEKLRSDLRNRFDDNYWSQLTNLKPLRIWNQPLPVTGDYQRHAAEVKIEGLPVGAYLLLASSKADFNVSKNVLAVQLFHVSSISYIAHRNEYFVLDRVSGKPLPKAAIQVWLEKYDYNARRNALARLTSHVADNNGHFRFNEAKNRDDANLRLEIKYQNDHLFLDDHSYYYDYDWQDDIIAERAEIDDRKNASVFLFTDRSIYRPGQTVYFKGIAVTKNTGSKRMRVFANQKTIVKLYNANGEPADSVQLTTSEFGSYSGKFILPQSLLNGEFRIEDAALHGSTPVLIEEYKRPAFYVDFDTLKGSYKVNDSITVTGFARAYAGNNIGGATVKYRIFRQPRFIYPWLFRKWGLPQSNPLEIANGVTSTDAEGRVSTRFKAIPDAQLKKELDPVFDYRVIIDVTDINGETRTGEKIIPVSYKALQLTLNIPTGDAIPVDSLTSLPIMTKNISGVYEAAIVKVSIHRLQSPERLIRKRLWPQPDQFVMTQAEYIRLFPHDEYRDESNYETWTKSETIYDRSDTTRPDGTFLLQPQKWTSGWYAIEASTRDRYGESVKDVRYIQLLNDNDARLPSGTYSWLLQKDQVIEPGRTAAITIGSSAEDLFVIRQIDSLRSDSDSAKSLPGYTFLRLNNEKKSFTFSITEDDRGGFGVNHFFVKDNRFYSLQAAVNVPWTNKELSITYETFRDKLLPGSNETWKLRISGHSQEKVAAEMLLSMYDASLDQFSPHRWTLPDIWAKYMPGPGWNAGSNFNAVQSQERIWEDNPVVFFEKTYDRLLSLDEEYRLYRGRAARNGAVQNEALQDVVVSAMAASPEKHTGVKVQQSAADASLKLEEPELQADTNTIPDLTRTFIRKNFNETAFFFPDLQTDAEGNVTFSFTLPEALTRWKLQGIAHTAEGAFGYTVKETISEKQLMVQPNIPRFLREGDRMQLSTKIVNSGDREMTGTVQLELFDAVTMKPVDGWFRNITANQYFTAAAGEAIVAGFTIEVPYQFTNGLVYRFTARSGKSEKSGAAAFADGEEASIPVLTNALLVTETMPLIMRGQRQADFRLEKLLRSDSAGETLQQHALTVEFSASPAWYAVQSLSFLTEAKRECADEVFNRYYANALAYSIINASPRIRAVIEKWRKSDTSALVSPLEKNQELKTLLLQETPWVLDAGNEERQKKDIALLFDNDRMAAALSSTLAQLRKLQSSNGGFMWFPGGPDDRFITQSIVTGIGRLKKLKALPTKDFTEIEAITGAAMRYLDDQIRKDYADLKRHKVDLKKNNTGSLQIQYLYLRSFFNNRGIPGAAAGAVNYFRQQSQQYWLSHNRYLQGMIALSLHRTGDRQTTSRILRSLQENAVQSPQLGMYWKEVRSGYYWYQAPVETQSLLIEAFSETGGDKKVVDELKTWLLSQKQTRSWKTGRATADACYALVLQGTDWLADDPDVNITLGDKKVSSVSEKQEAGTGYFKTRFEGPFVNPAMGQISVEIRPSASPGPSQKNGKDTAVSTGMVWGGVYWQYFENLDKITSSDASLRISKKLFVEKYTDRGPSLVPLKEGEVLQKGDKLKVRIELRTDRDMEYIHMKDMRASCLEPVNVVSGYKWQDGLGYYETTGDVSTNFFFNRLPKGSYVFEYPLFVGHAGNFSNGVATVQCMYAPEFSAHSEGIRLNVD